MSMWTLRNRLADGSRCGPSRRSCSTPSSRLRISPICSAGQAAAVMAEWIPVAPALFSWRGVPGRGVRVATVPLWPLARSRLPGHAQDVFEHEGQGASERCSGLAAQTFSKGTPAVR